MGFFSWNCRGCGESIKAPYDVPKEIAWQSYAVAIKESKENPYAPNGGFQVGLYDGYGKICGPIDDGDEVWHEHCWEDAGKNVEFTKASDPADDQGFFYDNEKNETV